MIRDYDKRGLKIIGIQSLNKSLKIKRLQGYFNDKNHAKWKLFVDFHLQKKGGKVVFYVTLNRSKMFLSLIQEILS